MQQKVMQVSSSLLHMLLALILRATPCPSAAPALWVCEKATAGASSGDQESSEKELGVLVLLIW